MSRDIFDEFMANYYLLGLGIVLFFLAVWLIIVLLIY